MRKLHQTDSFQAKILPLRLYVDQDAVDFLKKFFSFKDPHAVVNPDAPESKEAYIRTSPTHFLLFLMLTDSTEMAEIFPIDLKLDYKPRRVDYRALKEGKTIELMNFFHFDGAEMTLRHITLAGVGCSFSQVFPRLMCFKGNWMATDVRDAERPLDSRCQSDAAR